ncbi:polysaccharide pyruvyl transferase family protein [Azotobacter armeniacus]
MRLAYFKDWRGNFGDDLNIPFFNHIIPGYDKILPEKSLYGIGTLLNDAHGTIKNSLIFGSGFGYRESVSIDWSTTKVFGVRGPITAKKLGLDPDQYVMGDPAIYVEKIPELMTGRPFPYKNVVALHHKSAELWDFSKNNDTDLFFLDPGTIDIQSYISIIRGAEVVYAESLHGAIIAATFGIPFFPISIKDDLEKHKWNDFYALLGVEPPQAYQATPPKTSIIRRSLISYKARKIITPSKIGIPLSRSYIHNFKQEIASSKLNNKTLTADQKTIKKLQNKILNSIEDFTEFTKQ